MGPKQAARVPEAPWVHLWLWLSPQPWKVGFTTYRGVQQESSAHNLRDSEKGGSLPGVTQHSSAQTGPAWCGVGGLPPRILVEGTGSLASWLG